MFGSTCGVAPTGGHKARPLGTETVRPYTVAHTEYTMW